MERNDDELVEEENIEMAEEPTGKNNMTMQDEDFTAEGSQLLSQVRESFVSLLLGGGLDNAETVFEQCHQEWGDDLLDGEEHDPQILRALVLLNIESRLNEYGKSLDSFNLPTVTREQQEHLVNQGYSVRGILLPSERLEKPFSKIHEEIYHPPESLGQINDHCCAHFTSSQREVFERVMEAVESGQGRCFFVEARRGRMKLDLLNAIIAAVQKMDGDSIALAASSLKLASHLLLGGRTFHSLFKASLNVTEDSSLQIPNESDIAEIISRAKLIVVDEAVGLHKWHFEALDRKLREITGSEEVFGNKVIVLAGDFRQLLPAARGVSDIERCSSVINRSNLWSKFKVFTLNGRAKDDSVGKGNKFRAWLQKLGNGDIPCVTAPGIYHMDSIKLPDFMCIAIDPRNRGQSLLELILFVFRSFVENTSQCAILAPNDHFLQKINDKCMVLIPGMTETCLSDDNFAKCTCMLESSSECPSSRKIFGLPPHRLHLKRGVSLILLRTIPSEELSTGTRLTLKQILDDHLVCTVTGGREVYIPRMPLSPAHQNPQSEVRCQFPVEVAFAMTIHKSQGLTLKRAGVWLEEKVFTHGQLYTAASCVERKENIRFALHKRDRPPYYVTRNVVTKQVFKAPEVSPPTKKRKFHSE